MMKLLIIEDEKARASSVANYFESNEIICEHIENFSRALEKIELYNYDCILLGLNLPDGEGLIILKELKLKKREEGVIIISARESSEPRLNPSKRLSSVSLAEIMITPSVLLLAFKWRNKSNPSPSGSIRSSNMQS